MREISFQQVLLSGSATVVLCVLAAWGLKLGVRQSRLPASERNGTPTIGP